MGWQDWVGTFTGVVLVSARGGLLDPRRDAQYALRLDRASSVDDVLLNAAGAGLAALASRRRWRPTAY
ncbi:hypothetical protein ACFY1S_25415 [Micromonospora sp. NPDC000663]|uniref:hypothetical protein n=1 Tax=Micromonospora sp. NPDC000663 TaxID=3364218 RepID=UPI003678398E